jgi:hypothetical protein
MSTDFEGVGQLNVSPEVVAGFAQLDYTQTILERRELYSDFCMAFTGLLLGPDVYCEASEPFMPPGITIRALSQATPNKLVRRLSINTFLSPTEAAIDTQNGETTTLPQVESGLLRDYLIDLDRRIMRIGEAKIGKRMNGRLAMTSKKPTLLEPTEERVQGLPVVAVSRGVRFEEAFFSLPLVSGQSELKVLRGLLRLQPFLSEAFHEQVVLRLHYAQNDVAY